MQSSQQASRRYSSRRHLHQAWQPNGGDPFRIGQDGDQAAIIAKHERWLADQHHLLRVLDALRGHDLVCFCAPRACHGDLLLRLANATREERIVWWRAIKAGA